MLRTLILHINNFQKLLTNYWKKKFKKTGNVTFFLTQNWFVNLTGYIWIFSDYFSIFENPVYRKKFESYLRIVSIDYPETSWL